MGAAQEGVVEPLDIDPGSDGDENLVSAEAPGDSEEPDRKDEAAETRPAAGESVAATKADDPSSDRDPSGEQ